MEEEEEEEEPKKKGRGRKPAASKADGEVSGGSTIDDRFFFLSIFVLFFGFSYQNRFR